MAGVLDTIYGAVTKRNFSPPVPSSTDIVAAVSASRSAAPPEAAQTDSATPSSLQNRETTFQPNTPQAGALAPSVQYVLENPVVRALAGPLVNNAVVKEATERAADLESRLSGQSSGEYTPDPVANVPSVDRATLNPENDQSMRFLKSETMIPYGDLEEMKKYLGASAALLENYADIDDVVMHKHWRSKKAQIKIVDTKGSKSVTSFPNFILNSLQFEDSQRVHIFQGFDQAFIYLFGDKPIVATFNMTLYDMENRSWFREFYQLYRETLAGYQAAVKRIVTYILADDILFECAMLNLSSSKSFESNEVFKIQLRCVLTGMFVLNQQNIPVGQQSPVNEMAGLPAAEGDKFKKAYAARAAAQAKSTAPSLLEQSGYGTGVQPLFNSSAFMGAMDDMASPAGNKPSPLQQAGVQMSNHFASGTLKKAYEQAGIPMAVAPAQAKTALASLNVNNTITSTDIFKAQTGKLDPYTLLFPGA